MQGGRGRGTEVGLDELLPTFSLKKHEIETLLRTTLMMHCLTCSPFGLQFNWKDKPLLRIAYKPQTKTQRFYGLFTVDTIL